MRWFSTPESEAQGEMTWLSLIETAVATGIYVGIAIWTGSLVHLTFAACVAPFLLLRTAASQQRGVKWFTAGEWRGRSALMRIRYIVDNLTRFIGWLKGSNTGQPEDRCARSWSGCLF